MQCLDDLRGEYLGGEIGCEIKTPRCARVYFAQGIPRVPSDSFSVHPTELHAAQIGNRGCYGAAELFDGISLIRAHPHVGHHGGLQF